MITSRYVESAEALSASGKVIFRPSHRRNPNTKSKRTPAILRSDNPFTYINGTYRRSFEKFAETELRRSLGHAVTIERRTASTLSERTKNSSLGIDDKIRRGGIRLWTAIRVDQTEERAVNDTRNAVSCRKQFLSYLIDAVHSDLIFCLSSYRRR